MNLPIISGYLFDSQGFLIQEVPTYDTDILPGNVTRIVPPEVEESQKVKFNGESWDIVQQVPDNNANSNNNNEE